MFNIEKAKVVYSTEVYTALERAAALCVKNTNGDIADLVDRIAAEGLVTPVTKTFKFTAVDSDGFDVTVEVYPTVAVVVKKGYRGARGDVTVTSWNEVDDIEEATEVRDFINSNI